MEWWNVSILCCLLWDDMIVELHICDDPDQHESWNRTWNKFLLFPNTIDQIIYVILRGPARRTQNSDEQELACEK